MSLPGADARTQLIPGDCRSVLPTLADASFDAVVCDPPYELGFMGKGWDKTGIAFDVAMWKHVLRVLKPAGYMLCFGGTRTYHRLACAIEDAGFEIRDCLMWLYGQGMPKGQGCLKPAWEPILLARKPGKRVLPLGIDACRVGPPTDTRRPKGTKNPFPHSDDAWVPHLKVGGQVGKGRYPANVVLDEEAGAILDGQSGYIPSSARKAKGRGMGYHGASGAAGPCTHADSGGASRFFYCAKASKRERGESNTHPTVKPLALCRWLVRLITPPGGRVLDPFAGSGTTLLAAEAEGMHAVGIEQDAKHCEIIRKRISEACR